MIQSTTNTNTNTNTNTKITTVKRIPRPKPKQVVTALTTTIKKQTTKHTIINILDLPAEILSQIMFYVAEEKAIKIFDKYLFKCPLFNRINFYINEKILVLGNIQSGKTKAILEIIQEYTMIGVKCVFVLPNQTLAIKQYLKAINGVGVGVSTATNTNMKAQEINDNTRKINPDTNVILLLNNKFRYNRFLAIQNRSLKNNIANKHRYVLLIDESDQCYKNTEKYLIKPDMEQIMKQYHITATPNKKMKYNRIIEIPKNPKYHGLSNLEIKTDIPNTNPILDNVAEFLKEPTGMMLINRFNYITNMKLCINQISKTHPNVPVILLTAEKIAYHNNKSIKLGNLALNKIIDKFPADKYPHIIFVAYRLSMRCISYTSSDYTRHLTWQITKVKKNWANFMQSLRICGVYSNKPN